jgi:uncharacterized membrane protein
MQNMEAPNVRWGEWIGEGWQMFASQWQGWVVLMLVFILLILIPVAPIYIFVIGAQLAAATNPDSPPEFSPHLFVFLPVFYLVIILGSTYLMSGAYKAAFKQLRGGRISLSDLFSGGDVFLKTAGATILTVILTCIGSLFCVLPGLVVAGLLCFTVPLIVEGQLGVFDAMRASFDRTKGHWFMFTLYAIVLGVLAEIGSVACGIGILVTFPLLFTINAVAYRDLFGVSGAQSFAPQAASSSGYAQPWSAPQEPPAASKQCPRCGATGFAATAKFCNVCGANLDG